MKQTENLIKQGKEKAAEITAQAVETDNVLAQAIRSAEIVGAAKVLDHLAAALNAQAMRHWEGFQQAEGYRVYECDSFVDFLDKYRPMGLTKNKYYERKALLEAEGDDAFDLLNQYGVPATIRKQLSAGAIEITKDEIIVGDKSAPIGDAKQVKALFKEVVDAFDRLETKSGKTEKEVEKLKKRLEDAEARASKTVNFSRHDETDPANAAYLRVISALVELTRELNELPSDEAEQRLRKQYGPHISEAVEMMFSFSAKTSPIRKPDNVGANSLADELTDEELAELAEE